MSGAKSLSKDALRILILQKERELKELRDLLTDFGEENDVGSDDTNAVSGGGRIEGLQESDSVGKGSSGENLRQTSSSASSSRQTGSVRMGSSTGRIVTVPAEQVRTPVEKLPTFKSMLPSSPMEFKV